MIGVTGSSRQHGWLVLRFWNNEILADTDGVIAVIQAGLSASRGGEHPLPHPPPRARERG